MKLCQWSKGNTGWWHHLGFHQLHYHQSLSHIALSHMAMYRVSTGRPICWSISSFDLCKDIDYACNGFRKSQDGRWLESKWAPTLQQQIWKKEKKLRFFFNPIFWTWPCLTCFTLLNFGKDCPLVFWSLSIFASGFASRSVSIDLTPWHSHARGTTFFMAWLV